MAIAITHVISASLLEAVVAFYILPSEYLAKTLTTVFFYVLLVNFTIFSTYTLVVYPFFLSPLRHLPNARGAKPIVGHTLGLFERPPGATHLRLMKETPNDGLVRVLGFFHSEQLILTNPAALADVLVHKSYEFEKPPFARTFLKKFLGNGLLMTEGDEHKHHRKQIMPAFHFRHIKELYPVFWSKSVEMCDVVRVALTGDSSNVLEMGHYATQVTLDIIGLAGLGRDICSLRNTDDELIKNYEELLEPSTEKAVYFLVHLIIPAWLVAMLPWKLNETVRNITANLKRICTALVVDKKSMAKHESKDGVDVLSTMIRSDNFSDSNLVDQLLTFLAAG
jgi:cytochrome P450